MHDSRSAAQPATAKLHVVQCDLRFTAGPLPGPGGRSEKGGVGKGDRDGVMAQSAAAWEPVDAPVKGVVCVLAGISIFSLQDVFIKYLSDGYSVFQIVFVRSLVAVWLVMLIARYQGGLSSLRTRRPWAHLLRAGGMLGAYTCFYLAIAAVPLADAVALFFVAPLFITALSNLVLREPVGRRRWMAVLVGFAGVLIMLRPGDGLAEPAALFALLAALFYAGSQLATRRMGRTESGVALAFYPTVIYIGATALLGLGLGNGALEDSSGASLAFMLRAWAMPGWRDLALMAGCGLIAAFGFYFLSQAYRIAQPTTVAPFEYVALLLAVIWGYLFWQEMPDGPTFLGIALVVGSGLYVLRRETVRGRRVVTGRGLRPRV